MSTNFLIGVVVGALACGLDTAAMLASGAAAELTYRLVRAFR